MCLEERGRAIGYLEIKGDLLPNAMAWAEGSPRTAVEVLIGAERVYRPPHPSPAQELEPGLNPAALHRSLPLAAQMSWEPPWYFKVLE